MKAASFDSKTCRDLSLALKREWRETNSCGVSAASTIVGANTRREHGLLIVQLKPPLGRFVFLSNLEETLFIDDAGYPLSTHLYAQTVFPEGYRNLHEFRRVPFPAWIFHAEDIALTKSLVLMPDEQTLVLRYQMLSGDKDLVRLEVKPMTAFREVNALSYENRSLNTAVEMTPDRIRYSGVYFYHDAAIVDQAGSWCRKLMYPEEKSSGKDFEEDLYVPFRLVYTFLAASEAYLGVSLEDRASVDLRALFVREETRRKKNDLPSLTL